MKMIFFNGLGVTPDSWDPLIEKLCRVRNIEICKYDWGHHFFDSNAEKTSLTVKFDNSFAELSQMADRSCVFVGHSFGTLVAANIAYRIFGDNAKLIFICPVTLCDYQAQLSSDAFKKNLLVYSLKSMEAVARMPSHERQRYFSRASNLEFDPNELFPKFPDHFQKLNDCNGSVITCAGDRVAKGFNSSMLPNWRSFVLDTSSHLPQIEETQLLADVMIAAADQMNELDRDEH